MAALSRMPHHPGTRKNVYKGFSCPHCGEHIPNAKAALKHTHNNGSPPKNSHPTNNNNNKKGTKGGRRKTRRRRN
jgi:hypothetical protein